MWFTAYTYLIYTYSVYSYAMINVYRIIIMFYYFLQEEIVETVQSTICRMTIIPPRAGEGEEIMATQPAR